MGMPRNVSVAGFQRRSELSAASKPSHAATWPFEVSARWTGTIGHGLGAAKLPIASAPGSAGGAGVPGTTGWPMSAPISAALSGRL